MNHQMSVAYYLSKGKQIRNEAFGEIEFLSKLTNKRKVFPSNKIHRTRKIYFAAEFKKL